MRKSTFPWRDAAALFAVFTFGAAMPPANAAPLPLSKTLPAGVPKTLELYEPFAPQTDAAPAGFDTRRDSVERGKVETIEYDSKTVGVKRKAVVYMPPGYSSTEKYPVLYLLHGIGGNETDWTRNRAAAILDNLYADKKIVPMLVVMPNGRASAEPPPANVFGGTAFQDYARFEDDLIKDLIPYIDSHYSTMADSEHRALAGLSMGGGQSLNFGLKHLDTFAWVGGFSSAPNTRPAAELVTDPDAAGKKLRLLWVSCGDKDGLMNISRNFHTFLDEKKVPHIFHIDAGAHEWPVWKNDLYLFSQKIFQTSAVATLPAAPGNPRPGGQGRQQPPAIVSPEVQSDRRITFRLFAPQADSVRLNAGDIPGAAPALTKSDNGVWETTVGPVPAGAYRYTFNVNGVAVVDPRNPAISESNNNVWSLVPVPGSDFMDTRNVPHGAVAAVTYYSTALAKFRRMHVYTPPGYESGRDKYPVFYLLHGAGDNDNAWSTVGRAGFILDNLIADGKAKPMIVVMPAGHTRRTGERAPAPPAGSTPPPDEFVSDFLTDIMPYVEKNYRTLNDRSHRAIAGLSMGGGQTLNIALPHLDKFAYVGVFSSGLLGAFGPTRPGAPAAPANARLPWEEQHLAELDNANWKKGLKLVWFGTGKDDFLLGTTKATIDLLKKHNFEPVFNQSEGGHTWLNWRDYLNIFAPQLFR